MTPEERANRVMQEYREHSGGVMANPAFMVRAIAAAIREAENDERMVCTEIVAEITREETAERMRTAFERRKASQ